eukprot:scaffold163172_cov50-Attheya_sp.AAC.1
MPRNHTTTNEVTKKPESVFVFARLLRASSSRQQQTILVFTIRLRQNDVLWLSASRKKPHEKDTDMKRVSSAIA